jgi:hypothetical protein
VSLRRRVAPLVVWFLAAAPELAHACAGCIDLKAKNRWAFFATTIFLSALPLGMIAGMAWWILRRARQLELQADG